MDHDALTGRSLRATRREDCCEDAGSTTARSIDCGLDSGEADAVLLATAGFSERAARNCEPPAQSGAAAQCGLVPQLRAFIGSHQHLFSTMII